MSDAHSVETVIARCGGAGAIAEASERYQSPVTYQAVRKWVTAGSIPVVHWPMLMDLGGYTADDLLRIVQSAPHTKRGRPRDPLPGPAVGDARAA